MGSNRGINNKENLLDFILMQVFGRRNSIDGRGIEQLCKSLMEIEERKKPEDNREKHARIKEDIRDIRDFLRRPEILREIKSGIPLGKFKQKYLEQFLGDNKRSYDMSGLYNEGIIQRTNEYPSRKKVKFVPLSNTMPRKFISSRNREVIITRMGELQYEEWNGVKSGLSAYKIQIEEDDGEFTEYEVFSRINILKMENMQYQDAVLDELLSVNNIRLSNCGNYIGEIIELNPSDENDLPFTERRDENQYSYRLEGGLVLFYDSADASASLDFQKQQIADKSDKNSMSKPSGKDDPNNPDSKEQDELEI